jgi:CBS domain-containing protein
LLPEGDGITKPIKVSDIMVKDVVTIDANHKVKYAVEIMNRFSIGCLPVLDDDYLIGLITERDILYRIIAADKDPETTLVKDIMSWPVITVGPDLYLEDAIEIMTKRKIKKLPVAERHNDKFKIIGLVTLTDIVRVQPKLIELMNELFELEKESPPKRMEKVMNYYIV